MHLIDIVIPACIVCNKRARREEIMEDASILASGPPRTNAPALTSMSPSFRELGRAAVERTERGIISQALAAESWNRVRMARRLQMSYRALLHTIKGSVSKERRLADQRESSFPTNLFFRSEKWNSTSIVGALDRKTRRKLFYALVALFLLGAPLILLYSRGYVIDFQNKGLVQTGGIFVRTIQPGASIFIDSELYDKTSFISRGALITDLFPKRYSVRVEKEGYRSWQKVVRVSDKDVVEFRNVFLPLATATPNILVHTKRSVPARLFGLKGEAPLLLESGEPGKPGTVSLIDPKTGAWELSAGNITTWVWSPSSRTIYAGRGTVGRLTWYRIPVGGVAREIQFRGLPASFSAEMVTPHPKNSEEFFFFAGGAIFLQGNASVPIPIAEQVQAYHVTDDHIYFLTKNGFFIESNLLGGDTHILGRKGMYVDDEHPLRIADSPNGDIVVIDSAGGLFLYQPEHDQELQFIAGSVKDVDFSKNGDRMLYWDENRFWIYWLKDNPIQPFDIANSRRQIFATDAPITSAYLSAKGTHVYFAANTGIRMTEVDDRAGVNSYTLIEHPVDSFVFDRENLIPYWTDGGVAYSANIK